MDGDEQADEASRRVAAGFADLLDGLGELDGGFTLERFTEQVTRCCVRIFGVAGAGLSLAEGDGRLSVTAASSKPARVLETAAAHYRQGPGPDAYARDMQVASTSLLDGRWPQLVSFAKIYHVGAACAVPVRDGQRVLGALSLYQGRGDDPAPDLVVLTAVAKVAATWLQRGRELQRSLTLARQLQQALSSRVAIEQAKGMLAERWRVTPDEAFTALRQHVRTYQLPLQRTAHEVVNGEVKIPEPEI